MDQSMAVTCGKILTNHQSTYRGNSSHITWAHRPKLEQSSVDTPGSDSCKFFHDWNLKRFPHRLSQSSQLSKICQTELSLCLAKLQSGRSLFGGRVSLSKRSCCLKHTSIDLESFQRSINLENGALLLICLTPQATASTMESQSHSVPSPT